LLSLFYPSDNVIVTIECFLLQYLYFVNVNGKELILSDYNYICSDIDLTFRFKNDLYEKCNESQQLLTNWSKY